MPPRRGARRAGVRGRGRGRARSPTPPPPPPPVIPIVPPPVIPVVPPPVQGRGVYISEEDYLGLLRDAGRPVLPVVPPPRPADVAVDQVGSTEALSVFRSKVFTFIKVRMISM